MGGGVWKLLEQASSQFEGARRRPMRSRRRRRVLNNFITTTIPTIIYQQYSRELLAEGDREDFLNHLMIVYDYLMCCE